MIITVMFALICMVYKWANILIDKYQAVMMCISINSDYQLLQYVK